MSKSMSEIIIETVKFYAEDPEKRRGLKQHVQALPDRDPPSFSCVYYHENEMGEVVNCGIGRVLREEVAIQMQHCSGSVDDLIREYQEEEGLYDDEERLTLDGMLKEEYTGHSVNFWEGVQSLHDGDQYWDYDKGAFSVLGLEYIEHLCKGLFGTELIRQEVYNACLPFVKR